MNNLKINILPNNPTNTKTPIKKKNNAYLINGSIVAGSALAGFGVANLWTSTVFKPKCIKKVKEFRENFSALLVKKAEEYKSNIKALNFFLEDYDEAIKRIDSMEKNIIPECKKKHIKGMLIGLAIGLTGVLAKIQLSKKDKK